MKIEKLTCDDMFIMKTTAIVTFISNFDRCQGWMKLTNQIREWTVKAVSNHWQSCNCTLVIDYIQFRSICSVLRICSFQAHVVLLWFSWKKRKKNSIKCRKNLHFHFLQLERGGGLFLLQENGFGLCQHTGFLEMLIVAELTHKLTQDWNFVIQFNKIASPLYVPVHIYICTCPSLYVSIHVNRNGHPAWPVSWWLMNMYLSIYVNIWSCTSLYT